MLSLGDSYASLASRAALSSRRFAEGVHPMKARGKHSRADAAKDFAVPTPAKEILLIATDYRLVQQKMTDDFLSRCLLPHSPTQLSAQWRSPIACYLPGNVFVGNEWP